MKGIANDKLNLVNLMRHIRVTLQICLIGFHSHHLAIFLSIPKIWIVTVTEKNINPHVVIVLLSVEQQWPANAECKGFKVKVLH